MKTLLFSLMLFGPASSQALADEYFREVSVRQDSWEVVFHESGVRYQIEIDSIKRGTSGYLQRLRLLSGESLRLLEKHSRLEIRPVDHDGQRGLEIKRTYRDRATGEQKVETIFQKNHEAE